MLKDYICVDIENPNSRGNSICSIGIVIVKNNEVIEEKYSLINPEDRFDTNNANITGLSYADVKDSITFQEYWKENQKLFTENVVVGHNVLYDLNVIGKTLERYNIEIPEIKYHCTLKLAQRYIPTDRYSLDSLCLLLGINIKNHHNALEDSKATYNLFEYINEKQDIGLYSQFEYEHTISEKLDSKLETNINTLSGIIQGISYDGIIDNLEVDKLRRWVEENRLYKQYLLFDRIINKLEEILEDNVISNYERNELIALVSSINKSRMYSEATLALQILNGIIDGIVCNKKINQLEIDNLNKWLQNNEYLKDVYPYDKVVFEVNHILDDGILTQQESEYLLKTFEKIVNPQTDLSDDIDFNGKTFCLTGEFMSGSKQDISQKIQKLGGIEKSGVSSKLDYLVVGLVGSEAWKFGKIGGKQAKAMELNEKGANIKIIDEEKINEVE